MAMAQGGPPLGGVGGVLVGAGVAGLLAKVAAPRQCPYCGARLEPVVRRIARFCPYCGKALPRGGLCKRCDRRYPGGRYCPLHGEELEER